MINKDIHMLIDYSVILVYGKYGTLWREYVEFSDINSLNNGACIYSRERMLPYKMWVKL